MEISHIQILFFVRWNLFDLINIILYFLFLNHLINSSYFLKFIVFLLLSNYFENIYLFQGLALFDLFCFDSVELLAFFLKDLSFELFFKFLGHLDFKLFFYQFFPNFRPFILIKQHHFCQKLAFLKKYHFNFQVIFKLIFLT